ncbi:carboxymuconolactone decarboxylase family protein [Chitinophaga oryzae]|uniref:Carboxymuconolactone decarboxylase family protein n=1 Tax=Chitinophaga oryzae TaxID=2725414 RepID=A0AAE6ZDZ5_9BACT|nr:carboxymuconolactone decarboxylase family protein [Chitinophaga oryzae]QJB30127.1 carboxymuconolactone decarboxylase family protein [Chitinophaga oryzae]QJB36625.1 carboxymuconolactone decarboxylase family protein [Chitinophaga oryzae]
MSQRLNMKKLIPEGYKAILAMDTFLSASPLKKSHKDLIDIRTAQINGCAYCMDMHNRTALQHGESLQRLFVLSGWREAGLFSDEEKVILAMTEEITLIHQHGLSEETYQLALHHFDETYIAYLITAILSINALTRVGVSTHMRVPVVAAEHKQ